MIRGVSRLTYFKKKKKKRFTLAFLNKILQGQNKRRVSSWDAKMQMRDEDLSTTNVAVETVKNNGILEIS